MSANDSQDGQETKPAPVTLESIRDMDDKEEVDLSSLLDVQIQRAEGDGKQANRLILKVCGAVALLAVIGYGVSASMRREVGGLIQNVKESRQKSDAGDAGSEMSDALNNVMAKLGSHSVDIDHATRTLGADPTTVKEDGMDAEMKQMMGGEGRTSGERYRLAQNLSRLTGTELPKPPATEQEPTAPEKKPPTEEEPAKPESAEPPAAEASSPETGSGG